MSGTKIAVVGAGAIGGATAVALAAGGWDVEVVCRRPEFLARAVSPGFHVFGVRGDRTVPVRAVQNPADLSGYKDVVLLATKATECTAAAEAILPVLHERSAVVSLQNGICEEAIAEVVGASRIVGCVVGWGATMHGPGEFEVTSPGEFVVGNLDGSADQRLELIREMLDCSMPTRMSPNILGELYSKLVINSCINTLGVITGQKLGELLATAKVRRIFIGLMREIIAVSEALGIKVEPAAGGKLDFNAFLAGTSVLSRFRRDLMIRLIGFKYRRIRSSSLQSLERGQRTEIDYLNGYVCTKGAERGVPTPLNEIVVRMVKEIEAGSRPLSPANLDDPVFDGI